MLERRHAACARLRNDTGYFRLRRLRFSRHIHHGHRFAHPDMKHACTDKDTKNTHQQKNRDKEFGHRMRIFIRAGVKIGLGYHEIIIVYSGQKYNPVANNYIFFRRSSTALKATITVDSDINTAATAGCKIIPLKASAPAAIGNATTL